MAMIKTKEDVQLEKRFLFNLSNILESFPQYTISQHLCHLLRKKSDSKEAYFWTDEDITRKIEKYYDELLEDLSQLKEEED